MRKSISGKKYAPLGITLLAYMILAYGKLSSLLRRIDWRQTAHHMMELTEALAFFALLIAICSGLPLIL